MICLYWRSNTNSYPNHDSSHNYPMCLTHHSYHQTLENESHENNWRKPDPLYCKNDYANNEIKTSIKPFQRTSFGYSTPHGNSLHPIFDNSKNEYREERKGSTNTTSFFGRTLLRNKLFLIDLNTSHKNKTDTTISVGVFDFVFSKCKSKATSDSPKETITFTWHIE